ncbi:MAG TPA: uracil-DNA glycosylase [Xanthobacteraceae bacterium]|nr:uracil-DNA glycosylase [Xanthobacteraceae bacterium]
MPARSSAKRRSKLASPGRDCPLCPRLVAFRKANRKAEPGWFNAPVPSFGPREARLLIVGLAPGLRGANRTGRPFTGDYAGELLYRTLSAFGFARGTYAARADDGFELVDARIVNSVRCVPPENKPTPQEIRTCRQFLVAEIAAMTRVQAVVALGKIAHDSAIVAFGERPSRFKFAHGARHALKNRMLFDSYHCSRYNTSTGVLTPKMFRSVFAKVRAYLERA